ncbi:hypothetical protein TIFTF001_003661 [Ficus carica]|uniref:Histone deacetylase complex subunit SAP18 n=1 Tax=Ficus carica TaxID=3494 RepID=A0AA88CUM2_FICCA|nr:hypothetical protein TIFTF001_003661 [Ficus carica]
MEKRSRDDKIGGGGGPPPHYRPLPATGSAGGRPGPPPPQSRAPPPALPRPRFEPVDREKTCPLLLRVFTKCGGKVVRFSRQDLGLQYSVAVGGIGGHHNEEDFAVRGKEPKDEVQIYTWKDATLRELTDLVKEVVPAARRRNAKLSFAFVYPDKRGRFVLKQAGMTQSFGNGRRLDDGKALGELDFQIGDYLDVAII